MFPVCLPLHNVKIYLSPLATLLRTDYSNVVLLLWLISIVIIFRLMIDFVYVLYPRDYLLWKIWPLGIFAGLVLLCMLSFFILWCVRQDVMHDCVGSHHYHLSYFTLMLSIMYFKYLVYWESYDALVRLSLVARVRHFILWMATISVWIL